jgi:uncharacterized phage protein gp47/JayE
VRDVLTNLTQGVAGEVKRIPPYDPTARPVRVPDVVLDRRPVKRVSLVAGSVESAPGELTPYVFTLNDYELVPTSPDDPDDVSTIRFLPFGRKPAPDTDLRVNYYPRNADPAPVTDLNVGSVVRTLVEALAKELAIVYAQLNLAYESGFVETATGVSLDRVVALLGLRRYQAGRPVGTVRFSRRAGSVGTISIPAGTPVTNSEDTIRYETSETHSMLAGESTTEVRVRGATADTPVVPEGTLTVIQRAIAGVDTVVNERATSRATEDETDVELRARARGAVGASNKGTIAALVSGLLQTPGVRAVNVDEFPNDVPGELRLSISLDSPGTGELPKAVAARIEELRPAGVRVIPQTAATADLAARISLVLAGSHLAPTEIEQIHDGVRRTLAGLVTKAGVGQKIRTGPLVSAVLADERIVDASIRLGRKGDEPAPPGADFEPPVDTIAELAEQDVSFEPDTFEQALPAGAEEIPVAVEALVPVTPQTGVPLGAIQSQIQSRLADFVAALSPGTEVDAGAVLKTLRDDAKYQIDPLGLKVTFSVDDQFAEVVQAGPSFRVEPGQVFSVTSVQATSPDAAR